jgi:hypothetical protein
MRLFVHGSCNGFGLALGVSITALPHSGQSLSSRDGGHSLKIEKGSVARWRFTQALLNRILVDA